MVNEAEKGIGAMELVREKEPDLAILDIRMPEMSGIGVWKKIRELKDRRRKTGERLLTPVFGLRTSDFGLRSSD